MSHTERSTKIPSSRTGLFATLCRLLRVGGSGAPSPKQGGRRLLPGVLVLAVLVVACVLPSTPALASEPPVFESEPYQEVVYATRAHIEVYVHMGITSIPPESKWHGEYAPAEADGEAPPVGSPLWVPAGSETLQEDFPRIGLGVFDVGAGVKMLQHLKPSTTYYARFHAENAGGMAEKTFKFTTTAIAKPEVSQYIGGGSSFRVNATSPSSAAATAEIETNGAQTEYRFEYAESANGPWKEFTSGAIGTVTVSEDFANPEATLTGLAPETTYYARVKLKSAEGEVIENGLFTTPTAKPVVLVPEFVNVTSTSARFSAIVESKGSETQWRFEYAMSAMGPWTPVPGGEGVISQAEAEAQEKGQPSVLPEGSLTGLKPATVYYVRLFAENKAGEAEICHEENERPVCEPISTAKNTENLIGSFETSGPPVASTFATHALHGESLRVIGSVVSHSVPTSDEQTITVEGAPTGGTFTLTFRGQTTAPIAFNASSEVVRGALSALSSIKEGGVSVNGHAGGPYRVRFVGAQGGVAQPQISADASGLTPSGAVTVATVQQGGEGYDTHYRFQYVSQRQFEEPGGAGGFAMAASTPEVDLGQDAGGTVGADLPALEPGETYRYRILATTSIFPVVYGEEQTLTVPAPAGPGAEEACPNQALRVGPSANLPDCRAYEQVTSVDKGGTQEIFRYGGIAEPAGAAVGEDGGHLMVDAPVNWGSGHAAGGRPYFFSREGGGWRMTSGSPPSETGVNDVTPHIFDPDLTLFGFDSSFGNSGNVQFRVGPPGGPYTTVASVPSAQEGNGWVAASEDFSKLVLEVADHTLLGTSTGTKEGSDLYEYSGGGLRQVNVGVGKCGANIVKGSGELFGEAQQHSSRHAVSADGSRVFFEAVPGSNCSMAKQLYVRVDGGGENAETVDIGEYKFVAATAQGTEVLLERRSGEDPGLYLYEAGSAPKLLSSSGLAVGANLTVSEDLSTVYIVVGGGGLYRYDIPSETLSFVISLAQPNHVSSSPDGRYFYFDTIGVAGVPGGALALNGGTEDRSETCKIVNGPECKQEVKPTPQVYRYDSVERVVECVSCASAFDPEPKLGSYFGTTSADGGQYEPLGGTPRLNLVSANGDFAFFETPAALVPSDVDGEVTPEGEAGLVEHASSETSVSSDVYEWRRDGVNGCAHLQGCLALITSGRGGLENLLIGTTPSGSDVFIFTHSQLVKQDNDTAGDIYDVRIGGGFPEPSGPVECEGDACSTPFASPSDLTPSSATFQGAGNVLAPTPPVLSPKPKPKPKPKARKHRPKKKRRAAKRKGRKSSAGRSVGRGRGGAR